VLRGRVALSDPKIARLIRERFVAAVGEHEKLTRGSQKDWWLALVRSVNPHYSGGSTQGYYVLRADGTGVAADNYPPRLPTFLEGALTRAGAKTTAKVSADDLRQAAPLSLPEGASVVRLFTRAKLADGSTPGGTYLGRDYLWVLKDEVEQLVASSNKSTDAFTLPRTLVARLVVFHLVDNTRGQVWP
jgi:hypothetical protein